MSAYLITRIDVHDHEAYKKYTEQSPQMLSNFGGQFIVRGGPVQTLEGPPEHRCIVVIKFSNREAAETFYQSPEYQELIKLRHQSTTSELIIVDGID